jgi:hypothetical protein
MFIDNLFKMDVDAVNDNREPLYREQSVVWASEGSADLGNGFHSGDCKRLLFYKFMGIPETNKMPVRVRNICDAGLICEDYLIDKFKKAGKYVDDQIRMEHKFEGTKNNVISSGKIDLLINDDNILKGIEIKSISSYKVAKVFGDARNFPLPAPKNLIQAMNYKKTSMEGPVVCNDGVERQIEEIYLLYIDRGTYTRMYFKVDLDEQDYAIITPIDQNGSTHETIRLQDVDSFETLLHHSTIATNEQSRLAELRFSLSDLGAKYDDVYNYVRDQTLPPRDYSMVYTDADVDREYQCGRLSKIKYNKHYKKHEAVGDMPCTFCNYRDKCQSDEGVNLV